LIRKAGGPPSKVLPVMGINADFAVVVIFAVRAPNCLEEEHIKVHVDGVFLNQFNRELVLVVSE